MRFCPRMTSPGDRKARAATAAARAFLIQRIVRSSDSTPPARADSPTPASPSFSDPAYRAPPRRRPEPIARARLLHIAAAREREMVSLDQHVVGNGHVVDLVAGLLRQRSVGIERQFPLGMVQEQADRRGG